MSFSAVRGGEITKADLDEIAYYANLHLTPQDVTRTFDLRRGDDPSYTPGTMTGAFAFSDPDDPATERWAWLDELNRIWLCLWNIPSGTVGNDGWDVYDNGVGGSPDFSSGIAFDRVANYWALIGSSTGYAGEKIVASPGPHCYLESPQTNLGTNIQVFKWARAIYTKEQPAFDFISGVMLDTTVINGDSSAHDYAGRVVHTFNFTDLDSTGLYGYFEIEFTRTSGATDVNFGAGEAGLELASSSGGSVGGTETWLQDGNKFYMWFGTSSTREEDWMIVSDGTYVAGDQRFEAWVDTTGWVWTKSTWRGGFAKTAIASSTGSIAGDKVIHPRNESVKAILKVDHDPHLIDPDDILDFATLQDLLKETSTTYRPVDTFIRNSLRTVTKEYLDGYPAGIYDEASTRALLVDDFNDILIDYPGDLSQSGAWSAITLREATQWLIDLETDDETMLQRLNRLLLEDAYGYSSGEQINRLPAGKVDPENEILDLALAEPLGFAEFESNTMCKAHMTVPPTAQVIYLADAIPQWAYHTALDYDLPNVRTGFANGERTGPRGSFSVLDSSGYEVETSYFEPAISGVQSMWPVFHRSAFGVKLTPSSTPGRTYTGEIPSIHTSGYAPYWDCDDNHAWTLYPNASLADEETVAYSATVSTLFDVTEDRMEYSVKNRLVAVYVSDGSVTVDPANPATYLFSKERGGVVFPDDFTAAGLLAESYLGTVVYFTAYNSTGSTQTLKPTFSTFYASGDEGTDSTPDPAPKFFPAYEPEVETAGYGFNNGYGLFNGDSYRFGAISGTSLTNLAFPVPQRGYMIREIVIQRVPVLNSSGIYDTPDSEDMEARTVHLGIMTGAGVIGGAIHGVYPGEFVSFEDVSIGAGVSMVRHAAMYPVLGGAPLAYYVTGGDGSERFIINACVEFQPLINNRFVAGSAVAPMSGGFYGPPFLSNTWQWKQNLNAPLDSDSWTLQPGTHRYGKNDIMPPLTARSISELYGFIASTI